MQLSSVLVILATAASLTLAVPTFSNAPEAVKRTGKPVGPAICGWTSDMSSAERRIASGCVQCEQSTGIPYGDGEFCAKCCGDK